LVYQGKKVNTDYLKGWDASAEHKKAVFMEYLYEKSGRTDGLFTGLWIEFCKASGEQARKDFFISCNIK
tara:strand:+ start:4552 stop:4758 length:207 start_codon:yes stop_codon:yes gene_type:complete